MDEHRMITFFNAIACNVHARMKLTIIYLRKCKTAPGVNVNKDLPFRCWRRHLRKKIFKQMSHKTVFHRLTAKTSTLQATLPAKLYNFIIKWTVKSSCRFCYQQLLRNKLFSSSFCEFLLQVYMRMNWLMWPWRLLQNNHRWNGEQVFLFVCFTYIVITLITWQR